MFYPNYQLNRITEVPGARVVNGKPREGERVRRQNVARVAASSALTSVCGSYSERSIDSATPCDYPYWHMMLWGTEPVYRLIRSDPTVSLARYIVLGPVVESTWDITWADGFPESHPAIQWTKDVILPMRRCIMREAVRCFDFGYQPFAIRWEIEDGKYVPYPRPLLPESTTILEDERGNFAGVKNQGEGKEVTLNNLESWVPSLDGEAGYKYGRSRYENIRTTAWANWLETLVRMNALQNKLSGIIPIVETSPDGYIDDDGNAVNFSTEGNTLLENLQRANGVRIERAMSVSETLKEHADHPHIDKLIAAADIGLRFYDAGNVSQALPGFIQKLEYLDKLKFRGVLRPERAGLEAVAAGSRADSEQHTATGAADSESIDADLTESFDKGPYYTALRLNFGEDVAKRLHLVASPLQERKQAIFWKFLDRVMSSDPDVATAVSQIGDVDAILSQVYLPTLKKKFADVLAQVKKESREAKQKQTEKPAVPPQD